MTGANTGQASDGAPAVILVEPQMGENIGATARAMLNCGLADLRLVRPRDGWPNEKAAANAAGADGVIDRVRLYERTEDAIADLSRVFATTARPRDMVKTVMTPRVAAAAMRAHQAEGGTCGIIFGPERSGLTSDDVALADTVITVPLNPGFTSLNLGQAVLLVAYEWFQAADTTPAVRRDGVSSPRAGMADMQRLFDHLETELEAVGFFRVSEKKPSMVRSLRNLLHRMEPTEQDVRSLHGVITALSGHRLGGQPRWRNP